MRKVFSIALTVAMTLGMLPATIAARQAQDTGGVQGQARSAQQQALAKHTVRIRSVDTGQLMADGTTNASGEFTFAGLKPGTYIVELVDPSGAIIGTSAGFVIAPGTMATVTVTASAAGAKVAAGGAGFGIFGMGTAASAALIGGVAVGTTALIAARDKNITICHKPTGTPAQTIDISENGWDAHAAHGDTRGACPASPAR